MKYLINKTKQFFTDEQGGEVAEWAVVVAILVSIAVFAYGAPLQNAITSSVTAIQTAITNGA